VAAIVSACSGVDFLPCGFLLFFTVWESAPLNLLSLNFMFLTLIFSSIYYCSKVESSLDFAVTAKDPFPIWCHFSLYLDRYELLELKCHKVPNLFFMCQDCRSKIFGLLSCYFLVWESQIASLWNCPQDLLVLTIKHEAIVMWQVCFSFDYLIMVDFE